MAKPLPIPGRVNRESPSVLDIHEGRIASGIGMTGMPWIIAMLLGMFMLGGCAIGVTHQYDSVVPEIRTSTGSKITVAAQDRRVYVLSRHKAETFVGVSRGGFGNPFDVTTASGQPLTEDFAKAIERSLTRKNFAVTTVRLAPDLAEPEAIKRLTLTAQKSILVTIKEWKADTYLNTRLLYDVTVKVLDGSGKIIGENSIAGTDNLGGRFVNPPEHARSAVPAAFRRKLEELFSAPGIADNL